jgi:heat shock protein HslJ
LPVDRPTLLFASDDGEVNGNASCNLFFGKARIEGTNLSFSPLGTTRRACGSEVDEQEFRYLQALDNSRSYTLSGGSLSLHGDNGGRLVRFSQMFSR